VSISTAQADELRKAAQAALKSGAASVGSKFRRGYSRIDNLGRHVTLKLCKKDVKEIRRRADSGEKLTAIAASYGISTAYVSMIWNNHRRAAG
jgi:hypothetical protein